MLQVVLMRQVVHSTDQVLVTKLTMVLEIPTVPAGIVSVLSN